MDLNKWEFTGRLMTPEVWRRGARAKEKPHSLHLVERPLAVMFSWSVLKTPRPSTKHVLSRAKGSHPQDVSVPRSLSSKTPHIHRQEVYQEEHRAHGKRKGAASRTLLRRSPDEAAFWTHLSWNILPSPRLQGWFCWDLEVDASVGTGFLPTNSPTLLCLTKIHSIV